MKTLMEEYSFQILLYEDKKSKLNKVMKYSRNRIKKLHDKSGYGDKETKLRRMLKYSAIRGAGGMAASAAAGAVGVAGIGATISTGGGMAASMAAYYAYRKYKAAKLLAAKEKDPTEKKKLLTKADQLKADAKKLNLKSNKDKQ